METKTNSELLILAKAIALVILSVSPEDLVNLEQ